MLAGWQKLFWRIGFVAFIIVPYLIISCISQKKAAEQPSMPQTEALPAIDTEFYAMVETPAVFNGGDIKTYIAYLSKNLKYPSAALKRKQQGTVIVQFGVDWYGKIRDCSILKSSGSKTLDDAALVAINASPAWEPAKNKTQAVGQLFMLQIKFDAKTKKVEIR